MNKKRGQITLFAILGISLVIAGIIVFFLLQKPPVKSGEELSGEFKQAQAFIEQCGNVMAREAAILIGQHGGYIDPLDETYLDAELNAQPTESDVILLNPEDRNTSVAYWYYARSRNCWHCNIESLAPSIEDMERQIGIYVDRHVSECLNNFTELEVQGYDVEVLGNWSTLARINYENIELFINYSVRINKDGNTIDAEKFYTPIALPLRKYYETAIGIAAAQSQMEFLDILAWYMLGQYSGLGSEKLPPISAYSQGYDMVFWSKTASKQKFEEILYANIPLLNVNNTANSRQMLQTTPDTVIYNQLIMDIFSEDGRSMLELGEKSVDFIYLGGIYMDISPSSGDLLGAFNNPPVPDNFQSVTSEARPENYYKFYYDISYPVIVQITGMEDNVPYTFMFALQGNIKENKLLSDWYSGLGTIPWSNDVLKPRINDPYYGSTIFNPLTGRNETYNEPEYYKKMFCDAQQRVSGAIKLRTVSSSAPLGNVKITYGCGTYANCNLGYTLINSTTNTAEFSGKLPSCLNGYIRLDRSGYLSKMLHYTSEEGKSYDFGIINLEPLIDMNVTVNKYQVIRNVSIYGSHITLGYSLLNGTPMINDTAIIILQRITTGTDEPYSQFVMLGANRSSDRIRLAPGRYTVEAQLLDYMGVTIYKECKEICWPSGFLGLGEDCKKIPEQNIVLKPAVWGGIKYGNQTPIFISSNNVNKTLEINIIRMPDPRCLEDLQELNMIGLLSQKYRNILMPKLR